MHQDRSLPRARRDGLLEEAVGEELLLYDQESHTAHCLSPIAASVWQNCTGEHDLTGLAQLVGASKDSVTDALRELREKNLLAAEPEPMQSAVPGESRREVIGRVARYGAAAAGGSMIVSAIAATPAMASSIEEIKGDAECEGPALRNCCICKNACVQGKTEKDEGIPSEEECKTVCNAFAGGFVSWHPNMICK